MARYFSQYCPSEFAAANVPVNYSPQQMPRQKLITGTIATALLCDLEIARTFSGTLWRTLWSRNHWAKDTIWDICRSKNDHCMGQFLTFANYCSPSHHCALCMHRT